MEIQVKGIPVYCKIIGEGKPFVMLHGWSVDHHIMAGCMEPIFTQQDGWKRIYIDLPGMGRTPAPEWLTSSDQMLEIVEEVIDQLIPGQPFAVAGLSYGGYLARGLVAKKREKVEGVLLICPMVTAFERELPQHVVFEVEEDFVASLPPQRVQGFRDTAVIHTREVYERYDREIHVGVDAGNKQFLGSEIRTRNYAFTFNPDDLSSPYDKPALFVAGRQDRAVGYRDLYKIIENYPRATYAVLDKAGHIVQIEQASLFKALVKEWLDRVERGV